MRLRSISGWTYSKHYPNVYRYKIQILLSLLHVKMISQRAPAAYHKMHFSALAVIAIVSSLSYPLPFSEKKETDNKKSNVTTNSLSANKKES